MRKNFGSKAWLYPMPVFIVAAYDSEGNPNAMTAAWGGIYTDDMIGICIDESHRTLANILASGAFTVSIGTVPQTVPCDYLGIVSGNSCNDKFQRSGFHALKSEHVNAPLIEELPMAVECEFVSYDRESNFLTGRIVNVCADECILTDGNIDPAKLQPVTYDPVNRKYMALGAITGKAFHEGKILKQLQTREEK